MTSRREFLSAGAAMGVLSLARSQASTTSSSPYPINEFEARIARKDFRDMTKDILPTPCMVVDLDMFNANVKHMAETAKTNGVNVRPHVKVHKSVDVAKHQVAAGAVGLTCATIADAELFSGARIKGVFLDGNSQPKILICATLWWPSSARLAMAFLRHGCNVSALCPPGHPLRFVTGISSIYSYHGLAPIGLLRAAIRAAQPTLIVPCD